MLIDRRTFAASALAALIPDESALVKRNDDAVARLLSAQVTDPRHPECGGFPDATMLYSAGSAAGFFEVCLASFVSPASRYHRSPELVARLKLAAQFLNKHQHADGTIDLLITNFHSTPDVGFVVHNAAAAAWLARAHKAPELFALLEPFLSKAGQALRSGGVHTPNHRWVVCEALAQIDELLPDPGNLRRIDQWLAEGIDIDTDGQFNERSTTIYNAVTDKALTVMALKLNRPELLQPVRRNLEAMLYLLHPGGEVVTEISTRQDRFERAFMDRYWFPLRLLAIRDGDGRFAELARQVEPRAASLSAYLRYPELSKSLPAAAPLPDNFEKLLSVAKAARIRRGALSATVLFDGTPGFFHLRHGDCVLQAVRFASAFFGKGQFQPSRWSKLNGGYLLEQELDGPYYQPFTPARKVAADEWGSARPQRPQSEVQRMAYRVLVRERPGGFALDIEASGTANVPLAVEISFREGTQVEGVDQRNLLHSGYAVARAGKYSIRFGPGFADHAYVQVRGAEAALPGRPVYLCGFTPLKRTIEFSVA